MKTIALNVESEWKKKNWRSEGGKETKEVEKFCSHG
jgi:hypothetical protein